MWGDARAEGSSLRPLDKGLPDICVYVSATEQTKAHEREREKLGPIISS